MLAPMKKHNLYLIGPMGSGKTSVGRQLASLTKQPYYDSDQEIEQRSGVTVSWIFEKEGEPGFRQREEDIIAELTALDGIILATGGGCVVRDNNRKRLHDNGIVIYLKVSLPIQYERTSRRKGVRPLMESNNPKAKLAQLNAAREPLYAEIANLIYDTDLLEPKTIAQKIVDDVKSFGDS